MKRCVCDGESAVTSGDKIRAEFSKLKPFEGVTAWDMEHATGAPGIECERVLDKLVEEGEAFLEGSQYQPMYYGCMQADEESVTMKCGCMFQRLGDGAVVQHHCEQGQSLVRDLDGEENEYKLEGSGVWIEKKSLLVHVYETDDGVVCDIYPTEEFRDGNSDTIASAYVFYHEVEDEDV